MSREEIREGNYIFKKFMDGRPVNFGNLHEWLDLNFVYQLNANYEWFALWRVVTDMRFIESGKTKVSDFARQMNRWFPDAPHPCKASEINRYKHGYLGYTPYMKWREYDFRCSLEGQERCKQSLVGYARLKALCEKIANGIQSIELRQ